MSATRVDMCRRPRPDAVPTGAERQITPDAAAATIATLEGELRTLLERHRCALDSFGAAVLIIDAETGCVIESNAAARSILGEAMGDLERVPVWRIEGLAQFAATAEHVRALAVPGRESQQTISLEREAGQRRIWEWTSRAYTVGGRTCVQWEIRDVTAARVNEQRLQLLASAAENSRDSIIITDAQLDRPGPHIVFANAAFTRITGYAAEEVIGRTPRLLQGPKTDPALLRRLRTTLDRGGIFEGEGINYRKDGTEFSIDWQIVPLRDAQGVITHYAAFQRDVTERKQAERVLAESEERYRLLVERSPDAMFVHVGGRIVFANGATVKLFGGESAAQIVGRDIAELASPAQRDTVRRHIQENLTQVSPLFEQALVRLDGTEVKVEGVAIPITYAGEPAVQIILHDLTERLELEEQFRQAQRLESLGMLAAGIAHDLNNVLAPILMGAPLLRETAVTAMDKSLLTDIEKSAFRGAGLVRQILGFAHGVRGDPQTVQLKHLIDDVVSILTRTLPKAIAVESTAPKDLWPVLANPTQIHQVLLNLTVNARDAMPDGGALRLGAENCTLDEEAAGAFPGARPGRWVVLQVEDTGTGIPAEVLTRMWEPFFTTKAPGRGTGLGLATVRAIVEDHRGFILVRTAPGRGTTFRVYLPPVEGFVVRAGPAVSVPRGNGELVLVVDDVASIRSLADTILTRFGYRVLLASDGTEALAQFTRHEGIALVITDLEMPNLAGAALAGIARRLNPSVKILAMSGADSGPTDAIRPESFADSFLLKPFTAEQILTMTHRVLHPGAT